MEKKILNLKQNYSNFSEWDFFATNLDVELSQIIDEGLDIEAYKDLFINTANLPNNEWKKHICDILFDISINTPIAQNYPFIEPSDLEGINKLKIPYEYFKNNEINTTDRILGAWTGRVCGCMLGKTVEGIRTDELIPFLKATNNYPMHRYILSDDLSNINPDDYKFSFESRFYADKIDGMPIDDDTNYTVLYQEIIEKFGKEFTPSDIAHAWLDNQPKNAYFTAERVAFCNFINGYEPPMSAIYKNPFREWIGAQIRADYFGYINPGNPEIASEMAWRDASISHTKNGIYGEMFVASMLAIAAETNNIKDIICGGLSQIPSTSRLYKAINTVLTSFCNGTSQKECFESIHANYNEHTSHGWCHTIPNAMIVTASLLYGKGDFGKSICMAVQTGFDTDCNAATVGSVLGMANGFESIPEYWTKPINNTIHTSIFGVGTVKITDRVELTIKHIKDID